MDEPREAIRAVRTEDSAAICQIYNHYILSSSASFEEQPLSEETMAQRIAELSARFPWLVYQQHGQVVAYAYLSAWKPRSAYRFSAESSIYLAPNAQSKGLGKQLYQQLLKQLDDYPISTVLAGISLPNQASEGLHQSLGFRKVAELEKVGYKFGRWINVAYWQLQIKTEQQLNDLISRQQKELENG